MALLLPWPVGSGLRLGLHTILWPQTILQRFAKFSMKIATSCVCKTKKGLLMLFVLLLMLLPANTLHLLHLQL